MHCAKCGAKNTDGALFCRQCGASLKDQSSVYNETKQDTTGEVKQNVYPSAGVPIAKYDPSKDYTPIGMWGYFGYKLLFAIPLIGQILVLIFSLGGTRNINLRNYARSTFCVYIILILIILIAALIIAL